MNWQTVRDFIISHAAPIALVFTLFLLLTWLILRRRAKARAKRDEAPPGAVKASPQATGDANSGLYRLIQPSFGAGLNRLKSYFSGREGRYSLPWFLLTGPGGSQTTELLDGSGIPALHVKDTQVDPNDPCRWWLFEEGVVLDLDSKLLALDDAKEERNWRLVSRLLYKARSRKAFDGMVLTIPARDLLGVGVDDTSRLEREAAVLFRRLLTLQQTAGVVFPIYILVTHAEEILGFDAFVSEIPKVFQQQIFGWSSTRELKEPYNPDWVGEAFQEMQRRIYELQLEAAHDGLSPNLQESFFRFPRELAATAGRLRLYLDGIFTQTAYHEPFYLRGIYFCGSASPLEAPPFPQHSDMSDASREEEPRVRREIKVNFLKEMFTRKVFAESNLAQPTHKKLGHTRKQALIWRTCLLIFLVGVWVGMVYDYGKLSANSKHLTVKMEQVFEHLKIVDARMREQHKPKTQAGQEVNGEDVSLQAHSSSLRSSHSDLFEAQDNFQDNRYRSIFLPSSFWSPLHENMEHAFSFSYKQIILRSLALYLQEKEDKLLEEPVQINETDMGREAFNRTPYQQLTDFIALDDWVDAMTELYTNYEVYHNLDTQFDLKAFSGLIQYAFDNPGYQAKPERAAYYREAMRDLEVLDFTEQESKSASIKLLELFEVFQDELFKTDRFLEKSQEMVVQSINQQYQWLHLPLQDAIKKLKDLAKNLEEMEQVLPQAVFLQYQENLGEDFSLLLDKVQRAPFLEDNNDDQMHAIYKENYAYYQSTVNPDFLRKAFQYRRTIRGLFNLLLFDGLDSSTQSRPRANFEKWRRQDLDHVLNLYRNYSAFKKTEMSGLAGGYWLPAMESLTTRAFEAHAHKLVAHVPLISYENRNSDQVVFFLETMPTLREVMEILLELGLVQTANDLTGAIDATVIDLLTMIDRELDAGDFFSLDLEKWDGRIPLLEATLEVRDEVAAKDYVEDQLEAIRKLAWVAARLVHILDRSNAQRLRDQELMVNRWKGILRDIDDYERKRPYPIVRRLERFFQDDLKKLNMENFRELTGDYEPASGYFKKLYNNLKSEIYNRGLYLEEYGDPELQMDRFLFERDVVGYFQEHLLGRFPFAPADREAASDVTPAEIRSFYERFNRTAPRMKTVYESRSNPTEKEQMRLAFIRRMEQNARFFETVVNPGAAGSYWRIKVQLHTNSDLEVKGNQVVVRSMIVGDLPAIHGDGDVLWRYGEPIILSFRWAMNSPYLPKPSNTRWYRTDESAAYFHFNEPWSLARLLARHYRGDGDTGLLRFEIPLLSKAGGGEGDAVIFAKLSIFGNDDEIVPIPTFQTSSVDPTGEGENKGEGP